MAFQKWQIPFFEQYNYNQQVIRSIIILLMTNKYNKWSDYEDYALSLLVKKHGKKKWTLITKEMKENFKIYNREGKQCRERWLNKLQTTINNSNWSCDQDSRLINLHAILGTKWKEIAKQFDNRSENSIKNHFYAIVRKSIRKMCKYSHSSVKAAYEIKPMTISKIYMEGMGQIEGDYCKKVVKKVERDSCQFSFLKQQYLEMTNIMNIFIFGNSQESLIFDKPSKEKVREIIEKIVSINLTMKNQKPEQKVELQDQKLSSFVDFDSNCLNHQNEQIERKQERTGQNFLSVTEEDSEYNGIFSFKDKESVNIKDIQRQKLSKLIQEFSLPFQNLSGSHQTQSFLQVNHSQPREYYIYQSGVENFDVDLSDFTEKKYFTTPRCFENMINYDQMFG